nr:unnamed protein product [Digitaria exilis]
MCQVVLGRLVALRLRPVKVESFVADIILAYFDLDGHNREPPSSTPHHSPEHRNGESPFLTPPQSPAEHRLEAVHLLDLVHQRYLGRGRAPDTGGGAVRYCKSATTLARSRPSRRPWSSPRPASTSKAAARAA